MTTPEQQPSDPWGLPRSEPSYPGFAPTPPVSFDPPPPPTTALAPLPDSAPPFATGPVVAQIGEISVTSTHARTPAGDIPLAGSSWHVAEYWHNEQKIPTWAIVLSIVGFCVLTVFSLLFLLAKETVYRGTVQVTVTNGTRQYVARIPVSDPSQVAYVHQQVNYARSLAAL